MAIDSDSLRSRVMASPVEPIDERTKIVAEIEKYSLVWQECSNNIRMAERFYVPGYEGYFPFFVWGNELEAFESKTKVELREEHLLKGILYGLYELDHFPKPWHQKKDRETLLYLLDVLGNGFKYENPEKMILDIAFSIRGKNGSSASRVVLEVGSALIPPSAKIKSDLICDLWVILSENGGDDRLLEKVIELVAETNLDEIHSDAKEIICYYGLCANVMLRREQNVTDYLQKYIYPNVAMPNLKNNIKSLLENPIGFTPQELRIV